MDRRLQPFAPTLLSATPFLLRDMVLPESYASLGFKDTSAQANFLSERSSDALVLMVHEPFVEITPDFLNPHMIACAFGTMGAESVVWYVGTNKSHELNDSLRGQRWGHYGLAKTTISKSQIRWKSVDGPKLTMKNHTKHVHGSANPYAVFALLCFKMFARATRSIQQHPTLPCAQLFHPHYSHEKDPSIQLIYDSLGYKKSASGNYVWYADVMPRQEASFRDFLERMHMGMDASIAHT